MQELFAALPALLKELGDVAEVRSGLVFAAWRKIAGENLNEHTLPLALDGERLVIAVADETWRRHLESLGPEMVFRINAAVHKREVKFIEFRIDASAIGRSRTGADLTAERAAIAEREITPELRRSAELITNKDVRRQFLLAAASCLERQRRIRPPQ